MDACVCARVTQTDLSVCLEVQDFHVDWAEKSELRPNWFMEKVESIRQPSFMNFGRIVFFRTFALNIIELVSTCFNMIDTCSTCVKVL